MVRNCDVEVWASRWIFMFNFCHVQIIRAPALEKLLDEGRATLNKFKEEQNQRARRNSITGRLRSSLVKSRSRLFEAAEAEPSATQVPSLVPQPSRLSAMSTVGWENGIVDVEVEVSCVHGDPA